MVITAIRQTSPGRLTVELEDGTEIKSTLGVITDMRLFSGKELDESGLESLRTASERSITLERSVEYLSRRPMSRKELHDKLLDKGNSEETADYCVGKLTELGILNDENYAASLARHYASRGYGAGRIRSELYRHGISRELFDDAVSQATVNEEKIAKFISQRLTDPSDRAQIKKVSDALYRRGFSWDEIKTALRNYTDSLEFED